MTTTPEPPATEAAIAADLIARCPEHGTSTETWPECRCAAARKAAAVMAAAIAAAQPAISPAPDARAQLIEAMSGVSEERWCAGWMDGLDRRLHTEGGIWEILGRAIGWPVGDYDAWTWVTWDEAAALYADGTPAGEVR